MLRHCLLLVLLSARSLSPPSALLSSAASLCAPLAAFCRAGGRCFSPLCGWASPAPHSTVSLASRALSSSFRSLLTCRRFTASLGLRPHLRRDKRREMLCGPSPRLRTKARQCKPRTVFVFRKRLISSETVHLSLRWMPPLSASPESVSPCSLSFVSSSPCRFVATFPTNPDRHGHSASSKRLEPSVVFPRSFFLRRSALATPEGRGTPHNSRATHERLRGRYGWPFRGRTERNLKKAVNSQFALGTCGTTRLHGRIHVDSSQVRAHRCLHKRTEHAYIAHMYVLTERPTARTD